MGAQIEWRRELAELVGESEILVGDDVRGYLQDATEAQGLRGSADAVVRPAELESVAAVLAWADDHGVAVTPRGGGTGYAGGCVPDGGLVLSTERLNRVREIEPLLWRAEVEAGVTTRRVQTMAAENGLYYPVDPGAAEQSQIGGNVATNAGGPHTFKYGVTGAWVTGLEAVLASGEVIQVGGESRKDVAGYDLASLLIGSEGTLAVITSVHLKLIPAVEARFPVVAFFSDVAGGCTAIQAAMASGVVPAAIEYLDRECMAVAGTAFPGTVPAGSGMTIIVEADGSLDEASAAREALIDAVSEGAIAVHAPRERDAIAALWRWREGIGIAVEARRGGKVSEDICVPLDRLAEAILATVQIGERHRLDVCSWGHAGDANLHSTLLVDRSEPDQVARASDAAEDLFSLAIELGGTISGEHGIGVVKAGQLRRQWNEPAVALHRGVKAMFDPDGRLNPGKKIA